ncbi:ATP-binding protein [Chitinophaga sedimenti]|uniref:sensor histidine kinase n=1 Tax=Chitinophaga sedimenti TaxID=2033606 RepID=UPI002006854D|nr:ATP-binding protein [Chitinophaga sedimenti]MCK7554052.1 ATP-binding protein [Chitinophaga sedimenti]
MKEVGKVEIDRESIKGSIENIKEEKKVLAQLFKRLEPFGGRKKGRPVDIILEDAISNVFGLYKTELQHFDVSIILPDSKNLVRIDDGELQLILVNLIQNSLYWLSTINTERIIKVEVIRHKEELSIVFSDSGPGIKEEHNTLIFEPYFSTRPDGIGLGLTIVGELVTEYDGEFYLMDNGPLDGATFKITFRHRI